MVLCSKGNLGATCRVPVPRCKLASAHPSLPVGSALRGAGLSGRMLCLRDRGRYCLVDLGRRMWRENLRRSKGLRWGYWSKSVVFSKTGEGHQLLESMFMA
jgi:hypothetical protein